MRYLTLLVLLVLTGCIQPQTKPVTSATPRVIQAPTSIPSPQVLASTGEKTSQQIAVGKVPKPKASSKPKPKPKAPPKPKLKPKPISLKPEAVAAAPRLPEASYPKAGQPQMSPISESPTGPLSANALSARLDGQLQSGRLQAQFVGTGFFPRMVAIEFYNPNSHPIAIQLIPGQILRPPDGRKVQPLLLAQNVHMVLGPGESELTTLDSYCLDSRVPAPMNGETTPYRFSSGTREAGSQVQRVLDHALAHPEKYSEPTIQVALWLSMGQPVGTRQLETLSATPQGRSKLMVQARRLLREAQVP